jgi:MFS family permease
MLAKIRGLFRSSQTIPEKYRKNFFHLYMDIAWWGVLNGSILVFLSVYASRLGATTTQMGLITASPALVNLLFTFPLTALASKLPTKKATTLAGFLLRIFYFLLIPLPILFTANTQIWLIIAITLVMNIPGTLASVMTNTFFAETIPARYRAHVAGTRNAMLAATSMLTSFLIGKILDNTAFTLGYQITFAIGAFGAMLSLYHLSRIKPIPEDAPMLSSQVPQEDSKEKTRNKKPKIIFSQYLRLDVCKGPFGKVLILILGFYLAVFNINPTFPLYQVNVLNLTDAVIGAGSSVFWITHFLAATQTSRFAAKMGFKNMTAWGTSILCGSLLLFILAFNPVLYFTSRMLGGIAWAMINGSLINYVFERIPDNDRPAYLSWFNLAMNSALLFTGLIAPLISGALGLTGALLLGIGLRAVMAVAIFKWG